MYILGINAVFHESSACLIHNGKLIAFVEEERFNRVKHGKQALVETTGELPVLAINHCLQQAGITFDQIDHIAYSFDPKMFYSLDYLSAKLRSLNFNFVIEGYYNSIGEIVAVKNAVYKIPQALRVLFSTTNAAHFHFISHHLCHAASAYYVSPFEESAIMAIDGAGEIHSGMLCEGKGATIKILDKIPLDNSIGFLWEVISLFLGFSLYDASKVMGMAAYGDPNRYQGEFDQLVVINKDETSSIKKEALNANQKLVRKLLGKPRLPNEPLIAKHYDIAACLQRVTEKVLISMANQLHKITGSENLCLAGGVALNCVANAQIQKLTPFKNIYVQPSANDAGTALGAAYHVWHEKLGNTKREVMTSPFCGPEFSSEVIEKELIKAKLSFSQHDNIEAVTAELLTNGNIIAWFQGCMEVGPRALGNRSLLSDPRNPNMREIMNQKVKHREDFRPFAPAVLSEKAKEWFEIPSDFSSLSTDFMLFTFPVKEEKRPLIPSVVHHDGSARMQTVNKKSNSRFHGLLSEFNKLTQVPILMNTSFNDQEPIVCTPEDAIKTFKKTHIDYLVLGDYLVSQTQNESLASKEMAINPKQKTE